MAPGPAVVQSASGSGTSSAVTVTLGTATTAGHCLVVIAAFYGSSSAGSVSSISLTGESDTFSLAFNEPTFSNPERLEFYTDLGCSGGATSVVVTPTGGSGTLLMDVYVLEVSGVATASALDLTKGTI